MTARVPADFEVRPIRPGSKRAQAARDLCTCGTCGRSWDDGIATTWTPAPGGRCPFEYFHAQPKAPRVKRAAIAKRAPPGDDLAALRHVIGYVNAALADLESADADGAENAADNLRAALAVQS